MKSLECEAILGVCIDWLRDEETYRRSRAGSQQLKYLEARLGSIVGGTLRTHWDDFRESRGRGEGLLASQSVLKACATAREAAIIDSMLQRDGDYVTVQWATLDQLRELGRGICRGIDLYTTRLNKPFNEAFGPFGYNAKTLQVGYINAAGLALAHTVERVASEGTLVLPEPGRPNGDVVVWSRDL